MISDDVQKGMQLYVEATKKDSVDNMLQLVKSMNSEKLSEENETEYYVPHQAWMLRP